MGRAKLASVLGALFYVVIRGRDDAVLIGTAQEWQVFGKLVERVCESCAAQVYACASDGRVIHLALEVSQVPIGASLKRISSPYARYVNQTRCTRGPLCRPYKAVIVDRRLYLVDLVLYVHLMGGSGDRGPPRWSTEGAYLGRADIPWVSTRAVCDELGRGVEGIREYRARRARGVPAQVATLFSRGTIFLRGSASVASPPSLDDIARRVAAMEEVSYDELLSVSRRRCVSRTRALVAIIAQRSGVPLAKTAAFLHRHPATLIKGMGRYRAGALGALEQMASDTLQCVSAAVTCGSGVDVTQR